MTMPTNAGSHSIRIAIASGKGGTGKTLIATSLFYSLQQHGLKVALIDCDAEEPNVMVFFQGKPENTIDVTQGLPVIDEDQCDYCGKCHEYCSYQAIFILPRLKVIRVMEDLCHGCGACLAACTKDAIREKEVSLGEITHYSVTKSSSVFEARLRVGVYSPVPVIKAAVHGCGSHQIVLMDAPPGTSCPFIHTVLTADYVILVTEPTPFGLSDLKQSVETLRGMDKQFGVIVNRAGLGNNQVYRYLEEEGIPLLLEVPFDKDMASIYSRGGVIAEHRPEFGEQLFQVVNRVNQNGGSSHN
ncbi:MAG: ATP-binding protein [Bacteroidales bacterium]